MTDASDKLSRIEQGMREVYETHALQFDAIRSRGLEEKTWLDRFLALMPDGKSILDLGCGTGAPIAGYFIEKGYAVTGLDYSKAMLSLARERYPDATWIHGDMRSLDLGTRFDGILGWDSFFHLTRDAQRDLLPKLAAHLNPRGVLMLNTGSDDGEAGGNVGEGEIYHASLAPKEYRQIIEDLGLEIAEFVFEDADCGMRTVLLARRVD